MKTVDHSYEQALIMHDNVHIHVIMNIIMTPNLRWEEHERLRWEDPMSEVEWGGGREPGGGLRGNNHDRHR